jgi:hypothetical protein
MRDDLRLRISQSSLLKAVAGVERPMALMKVEVRLPPSRSRYLRTPRRRLNYFGCTSHNSSSFDERFDGRQACSGRSDAVWL